MQRVLVLDKNKNPLMPCHSVRALGLLLEIGTGGRTKFNRMQQDYPKAHWIDATCVGESAEQVQTCAPIHKSDGYFYEKGEALSSATTRVAVSPRQSQ